MFVCQKRLVLNTIMLFLTGTVELLDVSDKLPGLVHNQGLTKWKVCIFLTKVTFRDDIRRTQYSCRMRFCEKSHIVHFQLSEF